MGGPGEDGPGPPALAPMLAGGVDPPPDLSGYLVEPKWDGVRVVVSVHAGAVRLVTRNGNDVTSHYPELAVPPPSLAGRSAVVDGEVVTFDDTGATSFQRLQRRMHVRQPAPDLVAGVPVRLMVFDVLWLDGAVLTGRAQRERRAVLEALALDAGAWHTTPLLPPGTVPELLAACREVGLEGYVVKRADAPYQPGKRSPAWVKLKCVRRREFVVGGWTPGRGGRRGSIGSLAVGCFGLDRATGGSDGRLRYVGLVGSGLGEALIVQLRTVFERTSVDAAPFADDLEGDVRFVEPLLVAEVAYSEVTEAATLRQPSLQGFRTDLDPRAVVADEDLQDRFDRRPARLRLRSWG